MLKISADFTGDFDDVRSLSTGWVDTAKIASLSNQVLLNT